MANEIQEAPPQSDAKRAEVDAAITALSAELAKQEDPKVRGVKIWVNKLESQRGMLWLGIALGESLGCSPFCGCAAKQMGEQMEPFLLERVPWLTRVVVEAQAPEVKPAGKLLLKLL